MKERRSQGILIRHPNVSRKYTNGAVGECIREEVGFELKYMENGEGPTTDSTHWFDSTEESIYQMLGTVKISTSLSPQGV